MQDENQGVKTPFFSYFKKPIKNLKPDREINLLEVYALIKGEKFEAITKEQRIFELISEEDARNFKVSNFDYVTFSGVFTSRSNKNLTEHSELMVIDFDDLEDLNSIKERLLNNKCFDTQLLFTSPSGNGLKWVVSIDTEKADHKTWFMGIANYPKSEYNIQADKSGKDISRACFLPHDPDVFIHPKYLGKSEKSKKIFDLNHWTKKSRSKNISTQPELLQTVEDIITIIELEEVDLTEIYENWLKIGFAFADHFGESGRDLFHRVSKFYPEYDQKECDDKFDDCLKSDKSLSFEAERTTIGTFFYFAKQAGIRIKSFEGQISLEETCNPFPVEVFPEPIQKIIAATNASLNFPIDFIGASILYAISISIGNTHRAEIMKGWQESAVLYISIVGRAGTNKSHPISFALNPIEKRDKLSFQKYLLEKQEFDTISILSPIILWYVFSLKYCGSSV